MLKYISRKPTKSGDAVYYFFNNVTNVMYSVFIDNHSTDQYTDSHPFTTITDKDKIKNILAYVEG